MNHLLEMDNIRLSFGSRIILSDIYMKCTTGKITGLLGRNGQGKTCLLNIIYGELKCRDKSIRFDNRPTLHAYLRPDLLLFLPQFNFFPTFLTIQKVFNDFQLDLTVFEKRFPEFSLKRSTRLSALSGGQLRVVQTYIIIKAPSQFSLLDEPFTHLMPLQIEKMIELIREEKANKGFLVTDHLYQHIVGLSDDLYILAEGTTHLLKDPAGIEELGYARL